MQTLLIKIEALQPAIVKWDGTPLLNTQLEFLGLIVDKYLVLHIILYMMLKVLRMRTKLRKQEILGENKAFDTFICPQNCIEQLLHLLIASI